MYRAYYVEEADTDLAWNVIHHTFEENVRNFQI